MKNIFLTPGYGIPKNIFQDENYNFYSKMAFNRIYDISLKNIDKSPLIICTGGKTDLFKPYKKTEAKEISKLFKNLKSKIFLKKQTKDWQFLLENKSLSTLENLLNCQQIIKKNKIRQANLYIFCEQTRQKRIKILAKKIFHKNFKLFILPIDFDISPNRYLNSDFINKREKTEINHSLWALKDPKNLKKHQQLFKEKIELLRKAEPKNQTKALQEWWQKQIEELK